MKKTYTSSKMTRDKGSDSFETLIKRSFRNYVGTLLLTGVGMTGALAQTNPTPQPVPYTQNFNDLTNAYPAGWQGWRIAGNISGNFEIVSPSADFAFYTSNLSNSTSAAHIGNIGQRLGFLNTTTTRTIPALAVSTLDRQQIKIKYDINLQRVNSDRVLAVQLQYRIGTEGDFTPITESEEIFTGAGSGTNNSGTNVVETRTKEISLPAEVAFKENVQFRWVTARLQGGSGDNLGFSIDNVEVTGITDPCANNPIPYTEDFSELTTDVRECTLVENTNNDSETWKILTSSQSGFTAPYLRYRYQSTNAANDWFFTKGLALEAGVNYRIRYKTGTGGYDEKLKVSIGQEQNSSAMNQVIFDHGVFRANGSTISVEKYFTVTTSGNYYIGFHSYSAANQFYLYLDDIIVDLAPTCLPPSAVTMSNITHNTAQASWTAALTEASSYEYYISTDATAPTATTTATGTTTTTSATLSNLSQTTNYNLWVRSVCSDTDKSEWTSVTTFQTGQLAATFPFTDNFDGANNGWGILSNSTATNQLSTFYIDTPTSLTIGTGTTAANLTFANGKLFVSSETDNLSPVYKSNSIAYAYRDVTLPADITTAKVSFKWLIKGEGTTYAWDFGRFLIVPITSTLQTTTPLTQDPTALNNIFSFNENPYLSGDFKHLMSHVAAANTVFNGAYEEKANVFQNNAIDLSAHAGQTVRVLFYFRSDGSTQNAPSLIIDDFVFDYTPSCLAPTQMTASNVEARTADISWTASTSDVNGYEYYYSTEATAPTETTEASGTTTETTISLANLTPETTYYVWTKTDCSDAGKSEWTASPLTFTTTISCPAPTAPTTTNITTSSATIGWTSTATDFEYIYSTTNTAPEASATGTLVSGNTAEITGLDSTTTYYWWVRTVCGEDDKSSWLGSSFQTAQVPATFPFADNFDNPQWVFANGSQTNKFYIGTPAEANNVTYADNKLFVSQNGTDNTYSGTGSLIYAYRDVVLPADLTLAKITFDWIFKGEGTVSTPWDHGRFFIMPASAIPTAGTSIDTEANPIIMNGVNSIYIPGDIVSNEFNTVHPHLIYNPSHTYSGAFEDIKHTFIDEGVDLSAYAGQTIRLVFYFKNDSGTHPPALTIDNFAIDYAPSCLTPTNLATSNVTYNAATISWTGNSDTYSYVVSTTNEAPTGDTGVSTTENTVNLSDLNSATTYYWWMKSDCDSGDNWYQGPSFTTNATPQAYPFTDDFETLKWNLVNGNETNKFNVGTPSGSDNGKLFISENGNTNTYNVEATSRAYAYADVELPTDITTANVKFDWTATGETTYDYGRFFIVPTSYVPNNATNITSTGTITGQYFGSTKLNLSNGTAVLNEQVDLSAVAGQTVRLLFYWKNDASDGVQPPLSIDNFCFANECTELAVGDMNKANFAYYPNPVQNELNFKGEQTIANIEVYNLAGQTVNSVKVGGKTYQLNTAKLTAGVYMVKVTFENGSSKTVKIIKK
ncbi:T9SS type A sorting domain-containing protein [Faecalibacter bovis]|uniref:Fibronectin type III domain-containing protein n=1 Tax=Faecalibacter bovis TaxID=2898187 RepID=A0ABX7XEN0_9FLAO|nr:fibronectin type III domain-containing protein [Faecalibacter bovis]QTV06417.1 fibronectin type III domain-containing protein [Faecalibacter bovis]